MGAINNILSPFLKVKVPSKICVSSLGRGGKGGLQLGTKFIKCQCNVTSCQYLLSTSNHLNIWSPKALPVKFKGRWKEGWINSNFRTVFKLLLTLRSPLWYLFSSVQSLFTSHNGSQEKILQKQIILKIGCCSYTVDRYRYHECYVSKQIEDEYKTVILTLEEYQASTGVGVKLINFLKNHENLFNTKGCNYIK